MLVSTLMGLDQMKAAYVHAIGNRYCFYSCRDASLLLPKPLPVGGRRVTS
ncbi:S-adenosylmethionine:tRNA ribosyltransferase-isomerase [Sphingomonas sp. NPDC019816]